MSEDTIVPDLHPSVASVAKLRDLKVGQRLTWVFAQHDLEWRSAGAPLVTHLWEIEMMSVDAPLFIPDGTNDVHGKWRVGTYRNRNLAGEGNHFIYPLYIRDLSLLIDGWDCPVVLERSLPEFQDYLLNGRKLFDGGVHLFPSAPEIDAEKAREIVDAALFVSDWMKEHITFKRQPLYPPLSQGEPAAQAVPSPDCLQPETHSVRLG